MKKQKGKSNGIVGKEKILNKTKLVNIKTKSKVIKIKEFRKKN